MKKQTETYTDTTFYVDSVVLMCKSTSMPILADAVNAAKEQLISECQRVRAITDEKKQHAASYHRYVALQKELRERSETIDELAGMLGPNDAVEAMQEDSSDAIGDTVEVHTAMRELRDKLPLWKAIRWYVGYMGEVRMNDVLLFLRVLNIYGANRNAVDSALRTHPEVFSIRQKKGEKYIGLKGV